MLARPALAKYNARVGLYFCPTQSCFARKGPLVATYSGNVQFSTSLSTISPSHHMQPVRPSIVLHLKYFAWIRSRHPT